MCIFWIIGATPGGSCALDGPAPCCDTSVVPDVLQFLLSNGSIAVVVGFLIIAGLGLPIPEDLMLLAAGVLVHRGEVSFAGALIACAIGVFIGDTTIFLMARRLGPAALTRRPFRWLITPERHVRIEAMFARYGNVIVFMARHMAGLRAPTFAMAGLHGMPLSKFWLYDGLGLCVSAPVVIGIGYWLADNLDGARALLERFELVVIACLVTGVVGLVVWRRARKNAAVSEH